ncbi:MAG: hypothetical protein ACW97Z_00570 [Candidatus Hodarchaeales archaeon]|jgi:hypothetical protein
MDNNQRLGFLLSFFGAVVGIVGGLGLFVFTYEPYILEEITNLAAESGCEVIVKDFLPYIFDLSFIGGILFALSAYGFYTDEEWSVSLAVIGNTLCLLAGFWPMIPAMQMGLIPLWGLIFLPNLFIFFVLNRYVEKIPWITILFALITGIAYVMCFLNGIASTNRMYLYPPSPVTYPPIPDPIVTLHSVFKALQRVNWIAAIGFGIVTIGILRRPEKDWVRILTIGAALLGVVAGYPVAMASSLSFNKFSMFFMAPILATVLLLIPLWPTLWKRLVKVPKDKA